MRARRQRAQMRAQPSFERHDEQGAEQRPVCRARAADQHDQREFHADFLQRQHGRRIDDAQVHRKERAARAGQSGADRHAENLGAQHVDAGRARRSLVVAHRLQVVAEPAAQHGQADEEADEKEAEHQDRVRHSIAENHILQAGPERHGEPARPAGEGLGVVDDDQDHLVERHRRYGEEGAAQAKGRPRDQRRGAGGEQDRRDQRDPRRNLVAQQEIGGNVSADRHEDAVRQRELAAEPADDVPRRREAGVEKREGEHVQKERVARARRDDERERGGDAAGERQLGAQRGDLRRRGDGAEREGLNLAHAAPLPRRRHGRTGRKAARSE